MWSVSGWPGAEDEDERDGECSGDEGDGLGAGSGIPRWGAMVIIKGLWIRMNLIALKVYRPFMLGPILCMSPVSF